MSTVSSQLGHSFIPSAYLSASSASASTGCWRYNGAQNKICLFPPQSTPHTAIKALCLKFYLDPVRPWPQTLQKTLR